MLSELGQPKKKAEKVGIEIWLVVGFCILAILVVGVCICVWRNGK
jgi:hypothetical protein